MNECCICSAGDGCLAGHGECFFNPATTEQIIQRIVNGKYERYKETMLTELRRRGKNRITDYKCDLIKCAVCGHTLEINRRDTEQEDNVIESLNIIIRQQAEIENYSHNVKQLVSDIRNYQVDLQAMRISANSFKSKYKSAINTAKELQTVIKEKDAEIETLKAEQQMADGYADALVERTKAEAIKEYMKRLEEMLSQNIDISNAGYQSIIYDMDKAYEEMVGEE